MERILHLLHWLHELLSNPIESPRYRSKVFVLTFSRDSVIFYAKREPWGTSRAFDVDGA